jgi:hypothetical protein
MPNVPARHRVPARAGSARCHLGRFVLTGLTAASVASAAPLHSAAQEAEAPRIRVAPTIEAAANSETVLAIEVGPLNGGSPTSFMSLRGLPPTVSLRDGHAVGPGVWAVPLSVLPSLKAQIPAAQSGRSEVVISLIALDGRLLAQATSTLVIRAPAQEGAIAAAPVASPPPAAPPQLAAEQRARAERLLARGEAYLANGNIMGARDFFERAADAGLAASALQLGATYDPVELKRIKVQGVKPDAALARRWYERARDLGAAEATGALMRLGEN